MAKAQRAKGYRVERLIVDMHRDAGIPCEKVSRSGYTGEDLIIADEFRGEVKGRKEALKTIQGWIKDCDILIVKPDREQPMVVLPWATYVALIKR